MKRILILTIATILLIFAGVNALELMQSEQKTQTENLVPVSTTPKTEPPLLSHTFVLLENDNSLQKTLTLESIGSYNEEFVKSEQTTSQWNLIYDDTTLQISANLDDSSPFGSDTEPEVIMINSRLTTSHVYRIKVDENFYFYTNKYFNDSCGQAYCSNGLLETRGNTQLSIYCMINDRNLNGVIFCDQIVENLKLVT